MEKYAVVKEKLKKLSAEQTRGDHYDPFLPASKEAKNSHSKHPYNQSPQSTVIPESDVRQSAKQADFVQQNEQLTFDVAPVSSDYSQAATDSVARAIGTLQHRSHQEGTTLEVSNATAYERPSATEPTIRKEDLVVQEIRRLEMRAIDINNRSQQQADDILDLKRAAGQAAIAFARQGIHDHPQLEVITRFFDRYAASRVPIIERDDSGHFTLGDYSINLRRAEEEAIENAALLRGNRHQETLPAVMPFSQPVGERSARQQNTRPRKEAARIQRSKKRRGLGRLQPHLSHAFRELISIWQASLRLLQANASRKPVSEGLATKRYIENYSREQAFSFLDSAIWFSAAAVVARIALKTVFSIFPVFQPILWLAPLGLFFAVIYLLFVAKSSNSTMMYRLVLIALGLFLGGSF